MSLRFVHLTIVTITLWHTSVLAQTSDPIALLPPVESETISNCPRAVVRLPLAAEPEVEAYPRVCGAHQEDAEEEPRRGSQGLRRQGERALPRDVDQVPARPGAQGPSERFAADRQA